MMKRILHIVNDEKFINNAVDLFNSVRGYDHFFLIIGKRSEKKYIRSDIEITYLSEYNLLLPFVNSKINGFDGYIFHSLSLVKLHFLKKINKSKPVIWIGWGADYYTMFGAKKNDFLLPMTKRASETVVHYNWKKNLYGKIFLNFTLDRKARLLSKINFMNTVIYEDYNFLKLFLGSTIPDYIDWNYPVFNGDLEKKLYNLDISDNNILLGNSYQETNNHIDALYELASSKLEFKKVICPLSYGVNDSYKKKVIQIGKSLFAERFEPILDFIPFGNYMDIISSCRYFYIPTLRQQAVGNANVLLSIGASLILNKNNPLYLHYINNGVKVFDNDSLKYSDNLCLTDKEKEGNRCHVKKRFSNEVLNNKTKNLLAKMFAV